MNALALTDHGNLYGAIEFYRECKAAGLNPDHRLRGLCRPGKRTEREARRRGDAGFHLTLLAQNAHRLPEPRQDGLGRLPRGLSLRAAHRQGAARSPQGRDHLPERLRLQRVQRIHPQGPARRGRRAGRVVPQRLRQELLRRDPEQRPGHSDGSAPKGPSTSPTSSACRWWPPATPTISARTTPPPTTCCCASTPASCATTRTACATAAISSTSGRPRRCTGSSPTTRRRCSAARKSPTAATSSSTSRSATSPSSRRRTARSRRNTCASCAATGCASATATVAGAGGAGTARTRAGHHLPDGFRQLFPHRLGLRALRRGATASRPAPAARRAAPWSATSCKLSHVDPLEYDLLFERFLDPNRSRGARHRHRLLPGPPRGSHRLRPRQVRRGQRGPDRHLRHHGGPRRHQGRRPGARLAAGSRRRS